MARPFPFTTKAGWPASNSLEKYEIVCDIFFGFDYHAALTFDATPQQRLAIMAMAIDWVLSLQQAEAEKEQTEDGKKRAHRRYGDAVLSLTKAYAVASARDAAREIREEVGFFQAIRAALVKTSASGGKSLAERELAIQQIVSRAVVSTEIVDIMKAAGIQSPDISVLSDEFLAEVRDMERKNLALEALRKLINGEIRSQSKRNVTQSKAFFERLENAIARYHANAITTVQVLEDLIQIAKDIRAAARARGEETGLSARPSGFRRANGIATGRSIIGGVVTGVSGITPTDLVGVSLPETPAGAVLFRPSTFGFFQGVILTKS